MNSSKISWASSSSPPTRPLASGRSWPQRRGAIAVLAAVLMSLLFAFVAFGIDSGRIITERTKMQNAVDAAALAASQEIVARIHAAAEAGDLSMVSTIYQVEAQARQIAAEVAGENGVFIDPGEDVVFGRRFWSESTKDWRINWGEYPFNTVRVVARRDNEEVGEPDSRFPLAFGWAVGASSVEISVKASAFVEARDLVLVVDYSASMNDDTSLKAIGKFGQSVVEQSLDDIWDTLVAQQPVWPDTGELKFPSNGFGKVNSYEGTVLESDSTADILAQLELVNPLTGEAAQAFPQSGRNLQGHPNNKPDATLSTEMWTGYVDYVKTLEGPYSKTYGYRTLVDFLQESYFPAEYGEDMWRTPHYPFEAVKESTSDMIEFLDRLKFGDEMGLVSFGGYSTKETVLNDGELLVDISADPITSQLGKLDLIQSRKQAGQFDGWTGLGFGIADAREMLFGDPYKNNDDGAARFRSNTVMVVVSDGKPNMSPENWSLPGDWSWADFTDYNGDGVADYTTDDVNKQYAVWEAVLAEEYGVTIHTVTIGDDADFDLMQAIAFVGKGTWINVTSSTSNEHTQEQVLDAFLRVSAQVPQPRLIYEDEPLPEKIKTNRRKGNNGVGNGLDDQPPGDPPVNDGEGTSPGNPGNKQLGKR